MMKQFKHFKITRCILFRNIKEEDGLIEQLVIPDCYKEDAQNPCIEVNIADVDLHTKESQNEEHEENLRDLVGNISAEQTEETIDEPEERTTDETGEDAADRTGQGAEVLHENSIRVEAAEEPIIHDTEQDIQLTDINQDVRKEDGTDRTRVSQSVATETIRKPTVPVHRRSTRERYPPNRLRDYYLYCMVETSHDCTIEALSVLFNAGILDQIDTNIAHQIIGAVMK
ncbi:hypothetical protein DPMN_157796 [Dreissena polymorpha]|uniref:Uncharacterized protein n=1 Tax=Dreissena polymorpha TaxID=45954 RepID=A0A9D4EL75_DREPO|nr:hypothetical protein DPMN_157796 [Dreissena polymorpha]